MEDGSNLQLGESQDDFENGDYGILLYDQTATPDTTLTLLGDLAPMDQNPGAIGIQLGYDAFDNVLVGSTPEPGRADDLFDSTGNDLIQGRDGNDKLPTAHQTENSLIPRAAYDFGQIARLQRAA
jgi:hypothetical protein